MKKEIDPRMHSAEHILNGTMVKLFGCERSFNAHVESKKSKCDYYFNASISTEEIQNIEKKVNEIINSNLDIIEESLSKEDASKKYNLYKVPEEAGETIRIIKIGNYDACPCIGNHVNNTKDIGRFQIISYNLEKGILRIRFKLEPVKT